GGDRRALVERVELPGIACTLENVPGNDAGVVREVTRQRGEGPAQIERDRFWIDHLNAAHGRIVTAAGGTQFWFEADLVECIADIVSGERLTVAPLDAIAQRESPAHAICTGFPRRRQVRRR